MTGPNLEALVIYAWVGEDEFGSGKVGLKQGVVPAGVIPLVAMDFHLDRLTKVKGQMEALADQSDKKRYLCKFVFSEIVDETECGEPPAEAKTAAP